MPKKRKRKKGKKVWCVKAGKSVVSCHKNKSSAKRAAKARRKRGLKARVVPRRRR